MEAVHFPGSYLFWSFGCAASLKGHMVLISGCLWALLSFFFSLLWWAGGILFCLSSLSVIHPFVQLLERESNSFCLLWGDCSSRKISFFRAKSGISCRAGLSITSRYHLCALKMNLLCLDGKSPPRNVSPALLWSRGCFILKSAVSFLTLYWPRKFILIKVMVWTCLIIVM